MNGGDRDRAAARVHHASHRSLLTRVGSAPPGRRRPLDAVVVPAHRPVENLVTALDLARSTGCVVLAMCSGDADPAAAVTLAESLDVRVRLYAVDARWAAGSFDFLPGAVAREHWAAESQRAVARCRDIGLLVARLSGWQRVLFLDDDIRELNVRSLVGAVGWLGPDREAVGWVARSFRDNSVVCHANALAGNAQGCFVGSGALAVTIHEHTPFFPPLYNEDWLFLHPLLERRRVATAGFVRQMPFDPFASPQRAADQELGDLLAEGLYHLVHVHEAVDAALNPSYWKREIAFRAAFISGITEQLAADQAPAGTDPATVGRALQSLRAAADRLAGFAPRHLADVVGAWHEDQRSWASLMHDFHPLGSIVPALDRLGLDYQTTVQERTA